MAGDSQIVFFAYINFVHNVNVPRPLFLGIASLALSPSAEALVLPRFSGQTAHDLVSEEPRAVNREI